MSIENKVIPDQSEHKEQFEDAEVMLDAQKEREKKQSRAQVEEELFWLKEKVHELRNTPVENSDVVHWSPDHSPKTITKDSHTQNAFAQSRIHAMNPGSSPESNRGREQAYASVSGFVSKSVSQLPFGLDKFFLDA